MYIIMVCGILLSCLCLIMEPSSWIYSLPLLVGGVPVLVIWHRSIAKSIRALAIHQNGLVVTRRAGAEFIPWAEIKSVTETWSKGGDVNFPILNVNSGPAREPIRLMPMSEGKAVVERLVSTIIAHAGLISVGNNTAVRPDAVELFESVRDSVR